MERHPSSREEALQFLSSALLRGYGGDLIDQDQDLQAIRHDPRIQSLKDLANWTRQSIPYVGPKSN